MSLEYLVGLLRRYVRPSAPLPGWMQRAGMSLGRPWGKTIGWNKTILAYGLVPPDGKVVLSVFILRGERLTLD